MEIHVNLSILRNVFPIFSIKDLFKSPIEFMEGFEKRVRFGSESVSK